MNQKEYVFLQSEKNSLIHLIQTTPEEAVIDRISLEVRLQEVEEELQQYSAQHLPVQGSITFRGKPVSGSLGIESVFASKILDNFSSMISARASSYQGALSPSGMIPNRDAYRLNITGTAIGSFGFVFEEKMTEQQTFNGVRSPVENALMESMEFFEILRRKNIEELADAIDNTDDRVLKEYREFLKTLLSNEAVCTFESNSHFFRFHDIGEIQYFSKQIGDENIREWDEDSVGQLIGILPSERKFNFRVEGEGQIIRGKFSPTFDDLENITRYHLFQSIKVSLRVKQIGNGSQRYTLTQFERQEHNTVEA